MTSLMIMGFTIPVSTEFEMVPWLLSLFVGAGLVIVVSCRLGKDPLFKARVGSGFNHGDNVSWFFGIWTFYIFFTTFIAYINRGDPSWFFYSGYCFYYCVLFLTCIFLILPYLFEITLWKLIDISLSVIVMIIFQFIPWPAHDVFLGGMQPFFYYTLFLLFMRGIGGILYLFPQARERVHRVIKQYSGLYKRYLYSVRISLIVLVSYIFLSYLMQANVLIF